MLNVSWIALLGIGILAGIANCRTEQIGQALIDSASEAIQFSIGIAGIVALWCGLMNILKEAGFVEKLGKIISPVINVFFPEAKNDCKVRESIVSNIAANFLGLGNAATPYGIETVKRLQNYSSDPYVATRSVRLFLVTNSAAIQLIPSTIIALRANEGSINPSGILLPVWVVSVASLITALIAFYMYEMFLTRCAGRLGK